MTSQAQHVLVGSLLAAAAVAMVVGTVLILWREYRRRP